MEQKLYGACLYLNTWKFLPYEIKIGGKLQDRDPCLMIFCGRWSTMMMSNKKLPSKLMTTRGPKVNASQIQEQ
jgi:hypothetical protein